MDYEKCLVELEEVLNHLDEIDYTKIPNELIEAIRSNKDKTYEWKYDETKSLKEQKLDRNTIAMLSYINSEYLLNEDEKELMKKIYDMNEQKAEVEKKKKYNPDNLFKNKPNSKKASNEENSGTEELSLVEIKEQKWYQKVINYIKNLFKK